MTLAGALMLSARSGPAAIGEANRSMTIRIDPRAAGTGLFIGLMFGVCNVSIREASLSLGGDAVMLRAAVTVVVVTAFQVVLIGAWLAWREKGFLAGIWGNRAQAAFIGAASALGSICWFTAFTLANASYVIAVGQIEAVFAILVSWLYFRERLRAIDFAGIAIIVAGVLLLRLAG
ncbi:MAG: EamA family transporter [Hyphomicrobiaceae bacterium]